MLIINETELNYEQAGMIVDLFLEESKGSTFYYGKTSALTCAFNGKKYKLEAYQLKKYTKIWITEWK